MRYCAWPTCSVRVVRGYCPPHARTKDLRRGSPLERGYSARWTKRAADFRRRFPLCGQRPDGLAPVGSHCFTTGRTTPGAVVDHVIPHKGDPVLFWDELNNWQTLCAACHGAKTQAGA
jgi:5-methylcytosine-specific restriction protein A